MSSPSKRPNFFIVGAAKCGTTSLFDYLGQHPDIFTPVEKEPFFFGTDLQPDNYIKLSAYLSLFAGAGSEKRLGEASVTYMFSEKAAEEIREFCPTAKIIIMLRNPVDMMYSLHSERLWAGWENFKGFSEALDAEERRRQGIDVPSNVYSPKFLMYREIAAFSRHIERFYSVFSRNQVLVVLLDDLKADPAKTYRRVLEFLEVDPEFKPDFHVANANKEIRSELLRKIITPPHWALQLGRRLLPFGLRRKLLHSIYDLNMKPATRKPLDPQLRQALLQEFSDEIHALEQLIGRDLSAWLEPGVEWNVDGVVERGS